MSTPIIVLIFFVVVIITLIIFGVTQNIRRNGAATAGTSVANTHTTPTATPVGGTGAPAPTPHTTPRPATPTHRRSWAWVWQLILFLLLVLVLYFYWPEIKKIKIRSFFPSRPSSSQSTTSNEVKLPPRPVKVRVMEFEPYKYGETFERFDTVKVDETLEVRIPSGYDVDVDNGVDGLLVRQRNEDEPEYFGLNNQSKVTTYDVHRLRYWAVKGHPSSIYFKFYVKKR